MNCEKKPTNGHRSSSCSYGWSSGTDSESPTRIYGNPPYEPVAPPPRYEAPSYADVTDMGGYAPPMPNHGKFTQFLKIPGVPTSFRQEFSKKSLNITKSEKTRESLFTF